MSRRASRVDANQAAIVAALRGLGCSVAPLHMVGGGVPDLLVGLRGGNYLIEVKDGEKVASARKLTPAQVEFHRDWRGSIEVATSVDEAVAWFRRVTAG